ncbi:MAG: hypothetical protein ACTSR3_08350, partial [Candidatus Helarchaeota archaeon]
SIIYNTDLQLNFDVAEHSGYISNGLFDLYAKNNTGVFNLTYTAGTVRDYHVNQSLSPLGPTMNYHYGSEYFYAYSTEWIEICAYDADTIVTIYDAADNVVATNYLSQYDIWRYPSSGAISEGLYKVVSNNPVSIIVTSCTPGSGTSDDEVWAAYDTKILGRINYDLWITSFENDTHVDVYNLNTSTTVPDYSLDLDYLDTDYHTFAPANQWNVYLISSNNPVSVVAGVAYDGMFTGVYGKNQTDFKFPAFRTWGVIAEAGPTTIKWNSDKTGQGSRTLGEGEFYEVDSGDNTQGDIWVQLNATNPVRIFTRDYGNTGTAVASLNPTGTLFYVCDPGGGVIRMTAIADNTNIVYNQSSPSGKYVLFSLNKGGTRYETIANAGVKITSDKPIFVQYWDQGNPQSTAMYIPQETIPPRITNITLIENGSVFVKLQLTWESLGKMNTTDIVTVYNNYELFRLERKVWLLDEYTDPSFRILDSYIRGNHFDEYIYDGNTYGSTLNDTSFNAINYTVAHDRDTDLMSVGIFLTDYSGNGSASVNSVTWATDYNYFYDDIHLIPGYQTSMNTPSNPNSSDYTMFTFWELIKDNMNPNPDVYNVHYKLRNPLQISTPGEEKTVFFNLIVTVKDLDNNPAEGCKIFVNKTDEATLTNYTAYANSEGKATFTRLLEGNYSINVTYIDSDFGKELLLNFTPVIFLNTDNTTAEGNYNLLIDGLFITRYDFAFISYPTGEDLDGAQIHFYNMTGTSYEYLGNKTANDGTCSLYWTNTTGTSWNYTINVTFYAINPLIRPNITGPSFADKFNFSMPYYTSQTIEVQLEEFSTQLLNLTPLTFTEQWGQNLTFKVRYNYTYGGTEYNITDADFELQLSYSGNIIDTSSLAVQPVAGEFGNYILEFNSSICIAEENYIFLLEASKPGYESKALVYTFTINPLDTNIDVTLNSSVYWGQNLTITVDYTDNNSNDITDAAVTYTWGTSSGSVPWNAEGYYKVEINTSIAFNGYQIVYISVSRQNMTGYTNLPYAFNLLERETKLNNSDEIFQEIIIYANDAVNFSFYYVDVLSGQNITGAIATYSYNGTLYDMVEVGSGLYVLDFNTKNRAVGKYVLGVNIKKVNYSQPQMILFVNIIQRPISVTMMPPIITLPQRTLSIIVVTLIDSATGNPLSNLSLTYYLDGVPMGQLVSQGEGKYTIPIETSSLPIGAHYIIITLEHENYTMPVSTVSITVTYAQILGLDEPIFYTIVIAVAIAIAAVSIYVVVKSARIPYVIKKIDETIKAIDKGKQEVNVPVMKSKEQIYQELFGGDYSVLDLESPIKPTKAATSSIDEFKDLLTSMKGVKMTLKEIENLKSKLSQMPKEEGLKLLESMGIPPDASERLIKIAKQ